MILGGSKAGGTAVELVADRVRVNPGVLPAPAHLSHVAAYLDGLGAGAGAALLRAVIYDGADKLVARSAEGAIADGQAASWVQFRFDTNGGLLLPADTYSIGLHIGGVTNNARTWTDVAPGPTSRQATDTYADGAASPLPAASNQSKTLPVCAALFEPWVTPLVQDVELARLPWVLAQRVLGATGPATRTPRAATCGWHGAKTDPEVGAFCIVRSDGPFADLVGERVRVTYRVGTNERTVALYCHDEQSFPPEAAMEDLSLTKRAFLALAPLSRDWLPVSLQVLA
jgi:hypothetical protein